jgi:hypothetical protein
VEDSVDTATSAGDGFCVKKVGFDEIDPCGNIGELASGEVVKTANAVSARKEGFRDVRADEARDASDEIGRQQR